jgi:hypothetical protein
MRAIKLAAAAAFVLSGLSAPVQAQSNELVFSSWGSCNSYLNKARREASRGSDSIELARWDAAYCQATAFRQVVLVIPS